MTGGVKVQSGTGTMVRNYIFGEPIETDAVVKEIASSAWCDGVFQKKEDGFHYSLKEDEIVYGLGENVRGINKRGWRYISNCSDNPNHCENTNSLYGAHNFIMVGDVVHETYGLFVDTQGRVTALAHRVHNFCSHDTRKAPSQEGTLSTV